MSGQPRMFRITGHGAVHARFSSYVRLLEQLACDVEDYMNVLADSDDANHKRYVVEQLRKRLEAVFAASQVDK